TSTDISVMPNNVFQETRTGKIGGQDIGTPMIDIRTLGAGGGTVAWLGPDGLLKAGPHSAGADPGPACYGRGGQEPTVTDADLLLGYLGPGGLIGGRVQLSRELGEQAIRERIAGPLSLTVQEAALGISRVVNVNIEVGLRLSLMERGLDLRQFALVAFGGAGPVHAAQVARDLGIPRVIVPPNPGISCAMGLLQTDVKHYYLQSRLAALTGVAVEELDAAYERLEERALAEAREEGFDAASAKLLRQMDLRYPYQGYELTVPCPSGAWTEAGKAGIRRAFDELHQEVYGISAPEEVPDVVNLRVVSVSPVPRLDLPLIQAKGRAEDALIGRRDVLFQETGGYVLTPVYRRDGLPPGSEIEGPAIVEQLDSTTVILARQRAAVDDRGTLIITVEAV
ncbi:MAG TPA: hydantoinase/oxoprolinase family protein, partial [Chloroflexota bacterium]